MKKDVIDNNEKFVKRMSEIKPNFEVIGKWNGSQTKIKFKHLTCNTIFEATPNNMLKTTYGGCPECAMKSRIATKRAAGIGIDNLAKRIEEKYPDGLYRLVKGQTYINNKTKYLVHCNKCGNNFGVSPVNILRKDRPRGCPNCNNITLNNESKGVTIIKDWLIKHNIKFEQEVEFEGCVHKKNLKFDFKIYYPLSDDYFLLEFDGEQHFKPIFNTKNSKYKYEQTVIRDCIKNKFCYENNIILQRIKYYEENLISELLPLYLAEKPMK